MTAKEKIEKAARMLQRGTLAISEAEELMEQAIQEECAGLREDPNAWVTKYYKMKRRAWRELLKVTVRKS